MQILENIPLSSHSTMRLGGQAAYFAEINTIEELKEAVARAKPNNIPIIMIGDGSNIVWRDEGFKGLVLVNKLMKFEVFDEDDSNKYVTVGAGENWDSVVERTVNLGLNGIEQLSLIPGKSGAAPVQNIGAYGREIKDVLVTIQAFDTTIQQIINLRADECQFGYRTSRFKTNDRGRFLITSLTMHLTKANPEPPFYSALAMYLSEKGITSYTPQTIREAVVAIRSSKLPDPAKIANNGSFFINPIVENSILDNIRFDYPNVVYWPQGDKFKISAAWLLEQSGFKNHHDAETGMATWPAQPLVLVNESAKTTADLLRYKTKIIDAVKSKFSVELQQEPELI